MARRRRKKNELLASATFDQKVEDLLRSFHGKFLEGLLLSEVLTLLESISR